MHQVCNCGNSYFPSARLIYATAEPIFTKLEAIFMIRACGIVYVEGLRFS